eukprot:708-Heterococcus_DN1.PRE.2
MANTESADAATASSTSSTTVSFTSSTALTSFTTAYMCSLPARAVTTTASSEEALYDSCQCDDSVHSAQRKRKRLAAADCTVAVPTADADLATVGATIVAAAVASAGCATHHCSPTAEIQQQQQQQQQPAHISSSNGSSGGGSSSTMPLTQQAFARWCSSGSSPCDFDNIVGLLCEDVSLQQYTPSPASGSLSHHHKPAYCRQHLL